MTRIIQTMISGAEEAASSFIARREVLMRGGIDTLWSTIHVGERVFLHNISPDINAQEAWFEHTDGNRQALGRIRSGERSEIRNFRNSPDADISGTVQWKVRSLLLPWRSIWRSATVQNLEQPAHAWK